MQTFPPSPPRKPLIKSVLLIELLKLDLSLRQRGAGSYHNWLKKVDNNQMP